MSGRPLATDQLDLAPPPFLLDLLPTISPDDNDTGSWGPVVPGFDMSVLPSGIFDMELYPGDPGAHLPTEEAGEVPEDTAYLPGTNDQSLIYPTPQCEQSEDGFDNLLGTDRSLGRAKSTAVGSAYSSQYNIGAGGNNTPSPFGARRPSHSTSYDSGTPTLPLSLYSAEQRMMERSSGGLVSGNLLRIYHDVLEYSLSCWLTEDTCPYKPRRSNSVSPGLTIHPQAAPSMEGTANPTECGRGPASSNRIYRRVIKLDQVARSAKIITITRSEDRAASKALRLAIMAFATQWAQKSQRMEERYDEYSGTDDDLGSGIAEEFDRSLQRSFWEQARRALQDCADLETFKVVCAEVIFGWTQKPLEDDVPLEGNDNVTDAGGTRASLGTQIEEIISMDGLPVFLERAARKMRVLKFKVDAKEVGLGSVTTGHTNSHGAGPAGVLDSEDRGTVGLLYWLAVMADTISSSMHERPVVLADQDCQHDGTDDAESPGHGDHNKLHTQRWWVDLFIQDNPASPGQSTRWPCSAEEAAAAVQKSAPVKVLLYRHVFYLQNSLRGRGRRQEVEDIIQSAMLVYRYWNVTYGVFFRDLIENYDAVPPSIRGWFVCIHAHWHLAALMLADLIGVVDENDLGDLGASRARESAHMLERMRNTSACELSDLSRVSTPTQHAQHHGSDGEPQMPDFHFAVNSGTILMEPWTAILIRAYAKAYVLHFSRADELWRHDKAMLGQRSRECGESIRRCEECIRALWFLGKKSDMARRVSKTLARTLRALETCISDDML